MGRPKKSTHPVAWLRAIGGSSICFGGIGMIPDPKYFWLAVGVVYLGFVVLILDLFLETMGRRWKVGFFFLIFIVMAVFTSVFVLVKAPLFVWVLCTDADQPKGTTGNIQWRPEYARIDIYIRNLTDMQYTDMDLSINPGVIVAAAGTVDNGYSSVSTEPIILATVREAETMNESERIVKDPIILLASDSGYRMRCNQLPPAGEIHLILAAVRMKPDLSPSKITAAISMGRPFGEEFFHYSAQEQVKGSSRYNYWWGDTTAHIFSERPSSFRVVRIMGEFVAGKRMRHLSIEVLPMTSHEWRR
jgi:hypothetical protein